MNIDEIIDYCLKGYKVHHPSSIIYFYIPRNDCGCRNFFNIKKGYKEKKWWNKFVSPGLFGIKKGLTDGFEIWENTNEN